MSGEDLPSGAPFPRVVILGAAGGVGAIRAHDPGFDETSFLAWTEQVHFAVVSAMNSSHPEAMRAYVADSLYPRLAAQSSGAATAPKVNPNCERPEVVRAESNPTFDTIVVRLHSPGSSAQAVDWTFQRSSQLTTTAGPPRATTAEMCQSCGAPLKLDPAGDCVYCKTPAAVAKFDWVLVEMEPARPDIPTATPSSASGKRVWVIVASVIVLAVVGIPIATAIAGAAHKASNISTGSSPSLPSATSGKTLTVELTLTGAIGLSPSTLDMDDLSLNGGHFGDCPTTPVPSIGLDLTFDDGVQLKGTFTLPRSATPGTPGTIDLGTGGSAMLHQIGATGAVTDDQTWSLPAGTAGAATVTTTADGGGTVKWQKFPSGEPDHDAFDPLSGLITWTCR